MTWVKTVPPTTLIVGSLAACALFLGCMMISRSNNRASREAEQIMKFYYSKIRIGQDEDTVKSFLVGDSQVSFTHDVDSKKIYFSHHTKNYKYLTIKNKILGEVSFKDCRVSDIRIYNGLTGP